ncbi:hypothetical protein MU859_11065 (plasmid) [Lactobacillus kefiranofaciens subsp. kefirgranum]|nr:hypothetical protein [Lactobacillus kefiranofaciens]URW72434.1 hypothetical protein MU859_11065 [Lactobacillus kefiranofaciens subsp. kefirgranum]
MRTNDLVSLYVSFVETNGGKSRPVLIRRVSEQTVEAFKITSQYEKYPVQISTTTIYRGIFNGLFDNLFKSGSSSAVRHLRHHGKSRHNKAYQEKRGKIPIPNKIHDRPREATTV